MFFTYRGIPLIKPETNGSNIKNIKNIKNRPALIKYNIFDALRVKSCANCNKVV